jgi:hypothetical protein
MESEEGVEVGAADLARRGIRWGSEEKVLEQETEQKCWVDLVEVSSEKNFQRAVACNYDEPW